MQTEEKTLYQLDGVMIGKRIKSVRKAKGLTQEQLAERCGCTSTHISNIENGKSVFRLNCFIRSAECWIRRWTTF